MRKTNAALVALVAIATAVATTLALLSAYTGQVTNAFAEAPKWTLTYHENAGTDSVSNMPDPKDVTSYTGKFDISSAKPQRAGYTFLGWARDAASSTTYIAPGTKDVPAGDPHTDLYARWRPDKFILHYDVNAAHGGVSGAPEDQEATSDAASHTFQIANSPAITGKENRIFIGWSEDPEAQAPSYGYDGHGMLINAEGLASETDSLNASITISADKREETLYAIWATRFTLAFDANADYGGQGPVPPTQSVVSVSESHVFHIPAEQSGVNVPKKGDVAGYEFEKWGLTPARIAPEDSWGYGGEVLLWADGTKTGESQGNGRFAPSVTLYARYRTTEYMRLTYDANLPSGVSAYNMPNPNPEVFNGTETVWRHNISDKVPTTASRHFRGWATTRDATAPEYQPGAEFVIDRDVSYQATLYAVWQAPHRFSITFHANAEGASPVMVGWSNYATTTKSGTGEYGSYVSAITDDIDARTPTFTRLIDAGAVRVGYRLLGWSTDPNASAPDEGLDAGTHNPGSDAWHMKSYQVKLDDGESGDCAGGVTHNRDYYAVWVPQHAFQLNFDGNLPQGYNDYYRNYVRAYKSDTYDGIYQVVAVGRYDRGPAYIRTEYLDLSHDSFTLPAQAGMRAQADGLKFLGWATTPDATVPEYTVGEDGRFEQAITLRDMDACEGGADPLNASEVLIHHTTLYAVWQMQHRFAIEFHWYGSDYWLDLGGEPIGNSSSTKYGPFASRGYGTKRLYPTAAMSPSIREHTIAAGRSLYANFSGYRFLGWSTSSDATTVNYRVDPAGKLLDPITLADPDENCAGGHMGSGAIYHTTKLYAVYEPLHRFGVVFKGGRNDVVVHKTKNGWDSWSQSQGSDGPALIRYTAYIDALITKQEVPAGTMGAYATRTGYSFLGWAYQKDASQPDFTVNEDGYLQQSITLSEPLAAQPCTAGNVSHDITLYPVWEPLHAFGVRFNNLRGWGFKNLYTRHPSGSTNNVDSSSAPTGWAFNQFGVDQQYWRAEYVSTSQKSYVLPAGLVGAWMPDREGYLFKGWTDDPAATTPNPDYALTNNKLFVNDVTITDPDESCEGRVVDHFLDLYAVWEPAHRYQLRFNVGNASSITVGDGNGTTIDGSWIPIDQSAYTFKSLKAGAVKEGHTFLGWSRNPMADVAEYATYLALGSFYFEHEVVLDELGSDDDCTAATTHVIDLYPVFQVDYKLTYDGNSSVASNVPAAQTHTDKRNSDGSFNSNHTFQISQQVPTRSRFRFVGWSDKETGGPKYGYQNKANASLESLTQDLLPTIELTPATRNTTLYAIWYYEFEMNFELNATDEASWSPGTKQYAYSNANNVKFKIPSTDVAGPPQWYDTEAGVQRVFLGWNESSDGTGIMYQPGDEVPIVAASNGFGSKTLYAIWAPLTVAGGQSDTPLAAQSEDEGVQLLAAQSEEEDEGSPLFVGLPADPAANDVRHPGEDEAIVPADDEDAIE